MTRRGIEEVQAEDAAGTGRRGSNRRDGQRAGVRRQDRRRIGHRVESPEDRPLEVEILEGGLDHDVGFIAELLEDDGVAQAADPLVDPVVDPRGIVGDLRRPPRQAVRDPVAAMSERRLVDVVEDDLVAGLERELGDPRAHHPGTDDADEGEPIDRHQMGLNASNGWRQSRQ